MNAFILPCCASVWVIKNKYNMNVCMYVCSVDDNYTSMLRQTSEQFKLGLILKNLV